ncbi:gamma-glutamyl-gamma-aminobutyrate hydrolase family protein [Janthinobacterium sp. CG_23.3]|uniref:gamma-glutamyl-gamma-aminobutyrate hydrolase family protein n=1 Tax=Janthinobacterium sp. CG_23.3 TaxID=3349634 RepID=UPI0022B7137D|nr:gamma-glutamyl-gamma-aminobutyrate hydrolase family protein [Janthinobacterium sp. CG3]
MGVGRCRVNSLRHRDVMAGSAMPAMTALADDGVVEAVEVDRQAFCAGVQWHPECLANACEGDFFAALVRAARAYREVRMESRWQS